MKLIKDLGIIYPNDKCKTKSRCGMYECPICKKHLLFRTNDVNQKKSTKCIKCTSIERSKNNLKHGDSKKTKLYGVWLTLRNRCFNKNHISFINYGQRGITVCSDWNDFCVFKNWALENGYQEGLTIDRINNDGNYEPSNCRWVTMKVQSYNKRDIPTSTGHKFIYKKCKSYVVIFQKKGKYENIYKTFYNIEKAIEFKNYWMQNKIKKEYEAL